MPFCGRYTLVYNQHKDSLCSRNITLPFYCCALQSAPDTRSWPSQRPIGDGGHCIHHQPRVHAKSHNPPPRDTKRMNEKSNEAVSSALRCHEHPECSAALLLQLPSACHRCRLPQCGAGIVQASCIADNMNTRINQSTDPPAIIAIAQLHSFCRFIGSARLRPEKPLPRAGSSRAPNPREYWSPAQKAKQRTLWGYG